MSKRVLITGAAGFTGKYMCDYLVGLNQQVITIGTDVVDSDTLNCDSFHKIDLSCSDDVAKLIEQTKPDYIIHLAGTFGTKDSQEIYRVNVLSISALLEAACKFVPNAVIVATGSAAEYGRVEAHQLPIDEQTPCLPVMPYGLSKHLATQIAMYYHNIHNTCVMIARPFQLIGNGVTARLAPGVFAEQLKSVISKGSNVIKVGNLESSRDFLDIHDAVEAIWTLCNKPAAGQIFNLCSGQPTKIADLLQTMIDCSGTKVRIEIDPDRLRGKADASRVYGSYQKIKQHCGWEPKNSLKESILAMF